MRVEFIECKSRETAKKKAEFDPAVVAKVNGGFMVFENKSDYRTWKNQK